MSTSTNPSSATPLDVEAPESNSPTADRLITGEPRATGSRERAGNTSATDGESPLTTPAPLDVEACVRLLSRVALLIDRVGFDLDLAMTDEEPVENAELIGFEEDDQSAALRSLAAFLTDELGGLRQDKARLDWVDESAEATALWDGVTRVGIEWSVRTLDPGVVTLRAAIDAARSLTEPERLFWKCSACGFETGSGADIRGPVVNGVNYLTCPVCKAVGQFVDGPDATEPTEDHV